MVRRLIEKLRRRQEPRNPHRPRLLFDAAPETIYAIGDTHGCFDLLIEMERRIVKDAEKSAGEKWIVLLGDYIDRGPASAGVIDHLIRSPPRGFTRYCLAGNHEELMLSFIDSPSPNHPWLGLGGRATLRSYGVNEFHLSNRATATRLRSLLPVEHLAFLREIPSLLAVPGFVFVHAGLRKGLRLEEQDDQDLLWLRPDPAQDPPSPTFVTVHGHTPVPRIDVQPGRINVDTGAFTTSILSCVRIRSDGRIAGLSVKPAK